MSFVCDIPKIGGIAALVSYLAYYFQLVPILNANHPHTSVLNESQPSIRCAFVRLVHFKTASSCLGKPICTPPHLS